MAFFDFFNKEKKEDLDKGLQKTSEGIFSKLAKAVAGKTVVDEEGHWRSNDHKTHRPPRRARGNRKVQQYRRGIRHAKKRND